jgi:hypothetical protein
MPKSIRINGLWQAGGGKYEQTFTYLLATGLFLHCISSPTIRNDSMKTSHRTEPVPIFGRSAIRIMKYASIKMIDRIAETVQSIIV